MSLLEEKLTRDKFRKLYQDCKPSYELIEGRLEQKALGSRRHASLQGILFRMLQELGFRSYVELSLAISEDWEPIPDVAGVVGPETEEVYQSEPPAVAIEILSPSDRFTLLDQKCRRYAGWGIRDILVFDPVAQRALGRETRQPSADPGNVCFFEQARDDAADCGGIPEIGRAVTLRAAATRGVTQKAVVRQGRRHFSFKMFRLFDRIPLTWAESP
jgi:Uma2 family endonuclease